MRAVWLLEFRFDTLALVNRTRDLHLLEPSLHTTDN